MRQLSVFIVVAALSACADKSDLLRFNVDGVEYEVPAGHIRSFSRAPHQFMRVKAPGQPFDLAYDSRLAGRASSGWPVIFSLNDVPAPNVTYLESGGHKIVCRKASAPFGGCGFVIDDGEVKWSVLFSEEQVPAAKELHVRASEQLQKYRSANLTKGT